MKIADRNAWIIAQYEKARIQRPYLTVYTFAHELAGANGMTWDVIRNVLYSHLSAAKQEPEVMELPRKIIRAYYKELRWAAYREHVAKDIVTHPYLQGVNNKQKIGA